MNQQHLQNTQNAAKNYMNNHGGAGGNPQAQPHMMPGPPDGCGGAAGSDGLQQDLLMQQLQQIHQIVASSGDLLGQKAAPGASGAPGGGALGGNPESSGNAAQPSNATPQNILAALADFQKQQPSGAGGFGQDADSGFGGSNKLKGVGGAPEDNNNNGSGQPPQSSSHGQQILQQQIVDQKSVPSLDLNQQASAGGLNPMFYQNLLQQQLQGLGGFNAGGSSNSMSQLPSNNAQIGAPQSFDLLGLQQMQMGGLPNNYLPNMMPFMPPLNNQFSSGSMGSGGHMSGNNNGGGGGGHGSAASFHQPTEKNQVKLFVGGLAFSTSEQHLQNYFTKFGKVENTIVMREKVTQRGRGFGFVLLSFNDEDEAQNVKRSIIGQNKSPEGHSILDKRVDVKSADDHQGRGEGGQMGGGGGHQGGHNGGHNNNNNFMMTNNGQHIQKPNPYVQVVQKDGMSGSDDPKDSVKFTYPKSKIFVGGLDFKLTSEELKEHFMQFGEVHDAIILKDIYTGSSRGFGFVTFTNESVAQDLIKNNPVTEINGRRVDIKKAEPKDKSTPTGPGGNGGEGGQGRGNGRNPFTPGGRGGGGNFNNNNGGGGPMGGHHNNQMGGNQPAVIPPYGQQMDGGRNSGGPGERGGHRGGHRGGMGGHHQRYQNNRGGDDNGDGGHNNNYGGGRGDFNRNDRGGWNNRGNYGGDNDGQRENRGYRGGYDRNGDGGGRGGGHHRGSFEKRGSYGGSNNHHQNRQQQNNNGGNNVGNTGGNGNNAPGNARAGSSSSHESGQDSSYQISFERANAALRKRQEDANNGGQQQQQQGRPHNNNQGGHNNRRNDFGNNSHGGNSGNNRNNNNNNNAHEGKGFYTQQQQQQQQQQQNNNGGPQQNQMQNNANADGVDNKLNKQPSNGGNGDMNQRRRYRSRSRD